MLLAVLEKRGGFRLGTQDVFLNIAGGLRIEDPAIDVAVAASCSLLTKGIVEIAWIASTDEELDPVRDTVSSIAGLCSSPLAAISSNDLATCRDSKEALSVYILINSLVDKRVEN